MNFDKFWKYLMSIGLMFGVPIVGVFAISIMFLSGDMKENTNIMVSGTILIGIISGIGIVAGWSSHRSGGVTLKDIIAWVKGQEKQYRDTDKNE